MFAEGLSQATSRALDYITSDTLPADTYLAGGTAAALHLGHRISVDLDFFTPQEFLAPELIRKLGSTGAFVLESTAPDTILGKLNGVRFSIFRYTYPLLATPVSFRGFPVASLQDIVAMKIAAIADRGRKRDFIDLYFFLQGEHRTLQEALDFYDKKFGKLAANAAHIAKSLNYFTDAELDPMPEMLKDVKWDDVKKLFTSEAKKLVWPEAGGLTKTP